MYKPRGELPSIKEVLAKLKGEQPSKYKPVTYSDSDIKAAGDVLQRLINTPSRNEVSYTKVQPIKSQEP